MHLKRFADAKPYVAPNHRDVVGLRLQGFEANGPANQWVGLSQFLPGGGAANSRPRRPMRPARIPRRSRRSTSCSRAR